MWPIWLSLVQAAARRQRPDATDADVRDAVEAAESDSKDNPPRSEIPDTGIACVGRAGQSVFAPAVTLREFSNTTLAGVAGNEWIKTDSTVDVTEVA
ncbi:hypothetical protein [Haloarcula sp. CBA1127]|uniref:hypothetical protein n=1 Tax=Haloarcula sp. CBA1127 TaxID=1765055 RepID=UPI00073EA1D9|nr:hypothetical protein [Haloarcula sp. CBA1127]